MSKIKYLLGAGELDRGEAAQLHQEDVAEQEAEPEELKRQTEKQKMQLEEQENTPVQQSFAIRVSTAHFVSDTLMLPPPTSLSNAELFPQEQRTWPDSGSPQNKQKFRLEAE